MQTNKFNATFKLQVKFSTWASLNFLEQVSNLLSFRILYLYRAMVPRFGTIIGSHVSSRGINTPESDLFPKVLPLLPSHPTWVLPTL